MSIKKETLLQLIQQSETLRQLDCTIALVQAVVTHNSDIITIDEWQGTWLPAIQHQLQIVTPPYNRKTIH